MTDANHADAVTHYVGADQVLVAREWANEAAFLLSPPNLGDMHTLAEAWWDRVGKQSSEKDAQFLAQAAFVEGYRLAAWAGLADSERLIGPTRKYDGAERTDIGVAPTTVAALRKLLFEPEMHGVGYSEFIQRAVDSARSAIDASRGVHPSLIEDSSGGTHLSPESAAEFERIVHSHGTPTSRKRGVHSEGTASVTSEAVAAGTLPEVLRLRRAKMQRMFRDLREGVSRGAPSEILAEDFAALETFCVAQFHERSERPQDVSRVHTPAPTPDVESLIPTCLEVCRQRGWSLHWTARGAYLHLESSELIEAWRGKGKSTVAQEAGDVLLVLFSILGASNTTWAEAVTCATAKMKELQTRPRYAGEEFSVTAMDSASAPAKEGA